MYVHEGRSGLVSGMRRFDLLVRGNGNRRVILLPQNRTCNCGRNNYWSHAFTIAQACRRLKLRISFRRLISLTKRQKRRRHHRVFRIDRPRLFQRSVLAFIVERGQQQIVIGCKWANLEGLSSGPRSARLAIAQSVANPIANSVGRGSPKQLLFCEPNWGAPHMRW